MVRSAKKCILTVLKYACFAKKFLFTEGTGAKMFYCRFQMNYDCDDDSKISAEMVLNSSSRREWRYNIAEFCSELSDENLGGKVTFIAHRAKPNRIDMIAAVDDLQPLTPAKIVKRIEKYLDDQIEQGEYIMEDVKISRFVEITVAEFSSICDLANRSDYIHDYFRIADVTGINCLNNDNFKLMEKICSDKKLTYANAKKKAGKLLADESFMEELGRIYSGENSKHFYGQPVHYKIVAGNTRSAQELASLLAEALYANKRLTNRRISYFFGITENCYYEEDFEGLVRNAAGGVVVIEYEEVVEFIAENVRRNCRNTLFIFVEIVDKPGFSAQLIAKLQSDIHLIELQEGAGNRDDALIYLKNLIAGSDMPCVYTEEELIAAMGDKLTFRASDIFQVQEKLYSDALKNKSYPAYREVDRIAVKVDAVDGDAYQELQKLIGLKEQKDLIEQILAAHKVQKMRLDMGLDKQKTSLHMSFTGNPGSAKTTVSRLIAAILSKEGVLKTGRFIECGRADLVAKYVGWTAKTVREKFNEARGGVLFIDEAYSLSDGEHATFGDEAIHTIVQEMENHRDDVIVIFAGYPDKMKEFLDRNEGLRSRIAFHINFPDYNADELVEILKLMAAKKSYTLEEDVISHCRKIFKRASKKKNFGNGRFVRNLLEQASLKHARRIISEHKNSKVTKEDLLHFKVDDFKVNVDKTYKEEKLLGFKL